MSTIIAPPGSPQPRTGPQTVSYFGPLSEDAYGALASMEGVYDLPLVEAAGAPKVGAAPSAWPGYALTAGACVIAYALHYLPVWPFQVGTGASVRRPISAAILAILVGLAIRNFLGLSASALSGCKRVVRGVIPAAIILMGAELQLSAMTKVGLPVLAVIAAGIGVAIGASFLLGRALGLSSHASLLVGAGTAICGNSAIVAVAPLIKAKDEDVGWSVGTINALGLLVMLACPMVGFSLHLTDDQYGAWSGTAIHAVPQVVAAGAAFSTKAAAIATLVKLVRVAMLAPLVCVLAMLAARRARGMAGESGAVTVHYARLIPWFVWGFLAMSVLSSLGLIPKLAFPSDGVLGDAQTLSLLRVFKEAGSLLLAAAMAAIGLELSVAGMIHVGRRVFLCGLGASIALAVVSLVLSRVLL
ncbi:MAG: hypothetical protein BroJett003_11520 [Planctomycetota bacterium]|nr:MAG: hypothetical protein BroJett003_11520 [Planctomycetota bacterium]